MNLRKSSIDKTFTGVCAGIAEVYDITPSIVRAIFLFTVPISVGVYVFLALLLKESYEV